MKITICGSVKFIEEMKNAKLILERGGHSILLPASAELNQDKSFWNRMKSGDITKYASMKAERMRGHFDKIKSSEAIIVLNYDKDGKKNYIGINTLMEMAVAFDCGKKIFVLNPVSENDPYYEETVSMSTVCLNGRLENLK